jgi:hypothetical protein
MVVSPLINPPNRRTQLAERSRLLSFSGGCTLLLLTELGRARRDCIKSPCGRDRMDETIPLFCTSRAEDGCEHEDQAMQLDGGVVPLSHFLFWQVDRREEGGGKGGVLVWSPYHVTVRNVTSQASRHIWVGLNSLNRKLSASWVQKYFVAIFYLLVSFTRYGLNIKITLATNNFRTLLTMTNPTMYCMPSSTQ